MKNSMINPAKKREGFQGQKMVVIPKNIKDRIKNNPLIYSLYVTDIGFYPKAKHHYRNRKNGSQEYILIYCIEGEGWIRIESAEVQLKPHFYLIIPAHTAHEYGTIDHNPWSIYWIHFTGRSAKILFERYQEIESSRSEDISRRRIPAEKQRTELFDEMISQLESGYSMNILECTNMKLWNLLGSFMYANLYFRPSNHKDNNFVDAAITYMKNNLNKSITVKNLAHQAKISESHFYAVFKENTGYSPIQYFNHLRIQKACQFLSFTNLNINEISYKTGFQDPYYFSRLFKKIMDVPPSQYRKEYQN